MINKNRNLRGATIAAVATTMLGGASMATAAVPGFYMAGTIGQSSTDVGGEEQAFMDELVVATWESFGFNVLDGESDLDKSDIGFELAVGYQASPYFAVEAAYIDLGKAKYEAEGIVDNGGGPMDASSDLTSDAKGPALSLLGMLPVSDRFSLDARVGAMLGKSKVKFTASLQGESASESDSESGTTIFFGVGFTWLINERVGIRVGYTKFSDVRSALGDEFDVDRIAAGLKVSF
ncbi:MAG: outer membrane beta-barrel protein [Pseudomonadota bacterium]|jgi:OOP family OmpA-OmpF porin